MYAECCTWRAMPEFKRCRSILYVAVLVVGDESVLGSRPVDSDSFFLCNIDPLYASMMSTIQTGSISLTHLQLGIRYSLQQEPNKTFPL